MIIINSEYDDAKNCVHVYMDGRTICAVPANSGKDFISCIDSSSKEGFEALDNPMKCRVIVHAYGKMKKRVSVSLQFGMLLDKLHDEICHTYDPASAFDFFEECESEGFYT